MTVCIIDTSIFCELLKVPFRSDESGAMISALAVKLEEKESLLLPTATIFETGNHIAQNGDGRLRKQTAEKFIEQVRNALNGDSPFTPTPFDDPSRILEWLNDFPSSAETGSGFGDLSIIKAWEEQCERNPMRRVYIWSKDKHLQAYDQIPNFPRK